MTKIDEIILQQVLIAAGANIGKTGDNPSVACAITNQDHQIISFATTGLKGIPHAEVEALQKLSNGHDNLSLYCSLEPCCHYGKTPPCVEEIVKHNIKRVIIAIIDPDRRVNGKGIEFLKKHNIKVDLVKEDSNIFFTKKAKMILRAENPFTHPYITLKMAVSFDGKIALKNGQSKWITSEKQRILGHKLRKKNDAILVGINTIIHDDPLLNIRNEENIEESSSAKLIRVILDSNLLLPLDSKIVKTSYKQKTIVFCTANENLKQKQKELQKKNIIIEVAPQSFYGLNIKYVAGLLYHKYNVKNLLIEGGSKIFTSAIKENIVNCISSFQSPIILGNDAIAAVGDLNLTNLQSAIEVHQIS